MNLRAHQQLVLECFEESEKSRALRNPVPPQNKTKPQSLKMNARVSKKYNLYLDREGLPGKLCECTVQVCWAVGLVHCVFRC